MPSGNFRFFEFFCGGGMARLGLGHRWTCGFANDFSEKKAQTYRNNFSGAPELRVGDVAGLSTADLPDNATLVWASFPCQDLSLAGNGAGLRGERSGTFWSFWKLIAALCNEGRKPSLVVLENVVGAITSNKGRDFHAIVDAVSSAGYRVGAVVVDAVEFVPQSRPRLFIVAFDARWSIPVQQESSAANEHWHTRALQNAVGDLPESLRKSWVWWHLPLPPSLPRPESLPPAA